MDTHRSDQVRPSRAISPTFRSGPRHKPHDSNADEIIRFVREFQRPDVHQQTQSSSTGMKKKAVLPAIGGFSSSSDVITSCHEVDSRHDVMTLNPHPEAAITTRISNTSTNISTADSGFADKISEPPDSNSDDNEENNDGRYYYDHLNADNEDLDPEIVSVENRSDPFRYKSGVVDIRKESVVDFSDMKPVNRQSVVEEDQLISSRSRRPSKFVDKFLPGTSGAIYATNYLSKPSITSRRFSNGAPRHAQLLRPRALPQLPPITRSNDIPDRPSAPSPSLTPPSPRSGVGSDGDEYDNDFVEDDDETGGREPVDYIDCH